MGISSLLHRGSNSGRSGSAMGDFPEEPPRRSMLTSFVIPETHSSGQEKGPKDTFSKGCLLLPGLFTGPCLLSLAPTTAVSMHCILSSGQQGALGDLSKPCRVGASEI